LVGLVSALLGLLWESQIHPAANVPIDRWSKLGIDLLLLLGMTTFTMGIFTVVVEMKNWRNYFERGLSDIVLKHEYLDTLSDDQLVNVQTNALKAHYKKAYYKNDDSDAEGSFLDYCIKNIHQYVGLPYREDVYDEIVVKAFDKSKDVMSISEKLTYTCRRVGPSIQSRIAWMPDDGEHLNMKRIDLSLKYPMNHEKSGEVVTPPPQEYMKAAGYVITAQSLEMLKTENVPDSVIAKLGHLTLQCIYKDRFSEVVRSTIGDEHVDISLLQKHVEEIKGCEFELGEYKDVDGLVATMNLEYEAKLLDLQSWKMAHPTKNFTLIIKYPEGLKLDVQEFVSYPIQFQTTKMSGYYSARYSLWLLPNQNGVAWSVSA
jgi:hypothetical protein